MIAKCVFLPEAMIERMQILKNEKGVSYNAMVREALDNYLNNVETRRVSNGTN